MDNGRLAKLFAVGAFPLLVAGCDEHITDAVIVENDTTAPVHFVIDLVDGRSFDLPVTAGPGASVRLLDGSQLSDGAGIMRQRCTVDELRAIGPDGTVVDRLPPPICAPSTVVVDGTPSPS